MTLCVACALPGAAETPASLDTSETLFSVLAAMNTCGYDQELGVSEGVRRAVRNDIQAAIQRSPEAQEVRERLCNFYRDHRQPEPARDLANYVSLALNLGEPPDFPTNLRESDLPPDTGYILGVLPLLQQFHRAVDLHQIWLRHQPEYHGYIARFHEPVSRMLVETDLYLRLPTSGYVGRRFIVYLEPLAAPGQANARNYGDDYFVVVAPEKGHLQTEQVRHTYLHYILDPFALKRVNAMKRLEPLAEVVQAAPLDPSYKHDMALLVTESFIRAIEARLRPRATEAEREEMVSGAVQEGFILARYFYEALLKFEKDEVGLRDAYGDLLYNIDLSKERKRGQAVIFGRQAAPDLVRASKPRQAALLELAEERLANGEAREAERLARQALDSRDEDPARALFVLARAASLNRDVRGAQAYFERTLEVAREPRIVAWSHIYLGRILDLQEERKAALEHYRSALRAGDPTPDTRSAAERGLQQPYQPPVARREQ